MGYLGNAPALAYTSFSKQDFTVSATTNYSLDHPVANANELALFINFVRQEPTASYSASGTTLTLTEATSVGDDMYCVFLGKAVQTVNPPNASVGTSQLVDGAVSSSKLSSGKVLQVIGTQTDTVFSTTSTSFVDATGFSLSITPSSTSSKILVLLNFMYGNSASVVNSCQLLRNTDVIALGDPVNTLGNVWLAHNQNGTGFGHFGINYLDAPNSSSALTYKLQVLSGSGGTLKINARNDNNSLSERMGSLTLMEVSG